MRTSLGRGELRPSPSATPEACSSFDGGVLIGSRVAVVNNQAVMSVVFPTTGAHTLAAVYSGDVNWNSSVSNSYIESVTAAPTASVSTTNLGGNTALAGANLSTPSLCRRNGRIPGRFSAPRGSLAQPPQKEALAFDAFVSACIGHCVGGFWLLDQP